MTLFWQNYGITKKIDTMTNYNKGDVVLVNFIYSEEGGTKYRPAVIINSDSYHCSRGEVIVAAITSKVGSLFVGDYLIRDWKETGLLHPSVVTGILRTIKKSMIHRKLGSMPEKDIKSIEIALREILGL